MTAFYENDDLVFLCDICGDAIYDCDDCRTIEGYIICNECLREMSLCELIEITGITVEHELYDYLGFDKLRYTGEEEYYE